MKGQKMVTAAEIFQASHEDPGNVIVTLDFDGMFISCKPCAFKKQQLFGFVVLNTFEHGVCQFCRAEN